MWSENDLSQGASLILALSIAFSENLFDLCRFTCLLWMTWQTRRLSHHQHLAWEIEGNRMESSWKSRSFGDLAILLSSHMFILRKDQNGICRHRRLLQQVVFSKNETWHGTCTKQKKRPEQGSCASKHLHLPRNIKTNLSQAISHPKAKKRTEPLRQSNHQGRKLQLGI